MRMMIVSFLCVLTLAAGWAFAQSNIDDSVPNKYAWGENVGWTNWRDADAGDAGVVVGPFVMSGVMWGENIGFILVGDGAPTAPPYYGNVEGDDFGVNIDPDGSLHGLAWGENVGWINFDGGAMADPPRPARLECGDVNGEIASRLSGYAWGENIGWINLDEVEATKFVSLTLDATPLDCDMNHDGVDNGADVQDFVSILLQSVMPSWRDVCAGDVESTPDGQVDLDDVAEFVTCILTKE